MKSLLLLLLCLPYLLFSEQIFSFPLKSKETTSSSHVHVLIPSEFEESWKSSDQTTHEYKLQNESLETWTQIIILESILRYPGMLDFYLRKHKIAIESLFSSSELDRCESSSHQENGILIGHAHYRHPHYRVQSQDVDPLFKESMGMKLIQGDTNLYRITYNIKYPKNSSPSKWEEKIQTFLDSCRVVLPE